MFALCLYKINLHEKPMFAVPSVSQCLTFPIDALTFTRDLTWNHVIARKVKKSFFFQHKPKRVTLGLGPEVMILQSLEVQDGKCLTLLFLLDLILFVNQYVGTLMLAFGQHL